MKHFPKVGIVTYLICNCWMLVVAYACGRFQPSGLDYLIGLWLPFVVTVLYAAATRPKLKRDEDGVFIISSNQHSGTKFVIPSKYVKRVTEEYAVICILYDRGNSGWSSMTEAYHALMKEYHNHPRLLMIWLERGGAIDRQLIDWLGAPLPNASYIINTETKEYEELIMLNEGNSELFKITVCKLMQNGLSKSLGKV